MRKLYVPVVDLIRPLTGALLGIAIVVLLLTFNLGTLQGGISQAEVPVVQTVQSQSLSGQAILSENSLFLPYKLGMYALQKTNLTSVTAIRGLSVVFGLLGAVIFYVVVRKWHTRRIALLASAMFVSSSWYLYSARLAVPEATYLLVPWLMYAGIRLQENNLRFFGLGTIVLFVTLMLYIPGLCLFIIPAAIWQRKRIQHELHQAGRLRSTCMLIGLLVALVPLVLSFIHSPGLIGDWLGMTGPRPSLLEFFKNLIGVPIQVFLRSDLDPASHVGRTPYLDIATTALVVIGAYRYLLGRKLDRAKLLAAGLAVGTVLAAMNFQSASVLLPFLYIIVASGLAWLLQQWFAVFPRNPLARSIGVGMIVTLVALIGLFQLRRYFVAWPNTPETRAAYSITSFQE